MKSFFAQSLPLSRRSLLVGAVGLVAGCARPRLVVAPPPLPLDGPLTRVLAPDQPWEGTCAMPFSGGLHWDPVDQVFKCWYMGGWPTMSALCLAVSDDLVHWRKPRRDVVPGTNIVLQAPGLDTANVVPVNGRWYLALTHGNGPMDLLSSLDGVHWTLEGHTPDVGDRTTLFWNPMRERWSFCVRAGAGIASDPRRADLVESESFVPTAWHPVPWLTADPQDVCFEGCGSDHGQLYAVDVIPWGSELIGLLTIWRGLEPNRPKLNDVCWARSTDGLTWTRTDYQPFLTRSDDPTAWNYGNVQAVCGGILRKSGSVYAFASGRSTREQAMGLRILTRAPWE